MKLENLPAAHATHEVPDTAVPGTHALHALPVENCSGGGHWAQEPVAGSVYWPARHAERAWGVTSRRIRVNARMVY